jgi:tetratricopeptide (TPR) repeat protein
MTIKMTIKYSGETMYYSKICTRCHQNIAEERVQARPTVCNHCGHVQSQSEAQSQRKQDSNFIVAGILTALFMAGAFVHIGSWGQHSLAVLPLQIGELLGSNTMENKEALAALALDVKQFDTVERIYKQTAAHDQSKILRLAKFQISLGKSQAAVDSLRILLVQDAASYEGRYLLARSLGELGRVDEAITHYDYVLKLKPDIRQTTVLTNYVKMLMANNRLDEARKVIDDIRRRDQTASMLMDTEYKVIIARQQGST